MPIQNTDLMVIQQAGTPYKVSAQTLKTFFQTGVTLNPATASTLGGIKVGTNLSVTADGTLSANVTGAITYKGTANLTAAPGSGVTTGLATGHLYVNTTAGTIDNGWTGIGGQTGAVGEMVIWDGAKWDIIGVGASSGVTSVTGTAPVTIGGTATAPNVSVTNAVASASGAGGSAGLMTAVDKEKLDGIASGAAAGTVTNVTGTAPVQVATGTTTPVISVDAASTTASGIVQLADAAAVTAGTAGRVVTADQLKATNDAIATAAGGGITGLSGTAPVTVTGPNTAKVVAVADALTTAKGVVQLATSAETAFSVASPLATKAVTPAGLKANYMPLDITLLTLLP
jgi:hypothetical protein